MNQHDRRGADQEQAVTVREKKHITSKSVNGKQSEQSSVTTEKIQIVPGEVPHILLAEDNEMNWRLFQRILTNMGYRVTIVENGEDVLKAVKYEKFDLILMDMQMPKKDGFETTRALRSDPDFKIPIVALTAYAMRGDAEKCLNAGCDSYITKPINKTAFMNDIRSFFRFVNNAGSSQQNTEHLQAQMEDEMGKLRDYYVTSLQGRLEVIQKAIDAKNYDELIEEANKELSREGRLNKKNLCGGLGP